VTQTPQGWQQAGRERLISMTSRYAHVLPHVMADAAQRIGQALWGEA